MTMQETWFVQMPIDKMSLSKGIRNSVFTATLFSFFLFLALGNAFRIVESSLFSNHWLLSEGLLYALSFLSLCFLPVYKKSFLSLLFFNACFICSFLYGCLLHGFDLVALL